MVVCIDRWPAVAITIRHRLRLTFGCSTPLTGFDGINSSATAPFVTSWRS